MHGACGTFDTACTVHAVSLTPHAKYDRMNDRRTIPTTLAALKGISIKNIYVPEMYYPTPKKYVNLKGLPNKNARFLRSKIDHISANSKQNSKRL
jgi:hypothetical protein